jgi:hypothetical protein
MSASFVSRPASGINGDTFAFSGFPASDFVGGLVSGRLYIAWAHWLVAGATITVSGTGWTLGDHQGGSVHSSAWAWMVYSGTQAAAPTFTSDVGGVVHWGNSSWEGQDVSPIGHIKHAEGSSNSIAIGTVAVTKAGSIFLSINMTSASNPVPTPTNYTSIQAFSDAFASENYAWETNTCDSGTVTINSAGWNAFMIEILGPSTQAGTRWYYENLYGGMNV